MTPTGLSARIRPSALAMLLAIVGVSVVMRAVTAVYLGDTVDSLPGIDDQISYHVLAHRLLQGHGFSFPLAWWPSTFPDAPTAHWSYLYSLYLAAVYGVVGDHPLIARLIQAVAAGVLHPWLAWRLGRRLFGPSAGLVAAGLSACYAYFAYYGGALMTEAFTILAVLWMLDLATGMAADARVGVRDASARSTVLPPPVHVWLLLGLAIGIAALLRQVVLLFVPFLFAWLLWVLGQPSSPDDRCSRASRWRGVLAGLLVTTAVVAVLILPWTVRNYWAFGRLVPLNTNAGFAFFWANHPIHGTDFVPLLPAGTYPRLIPPELLALDEAALDQVLLREGLRIVADDPGRYALLSASRVKELFKFWPSSDSGLVSNVARVLSFGVCLPLMLYGLYLAWFRFERCAVAGQRPGIVLLCLFVVVHTGIHLLSWSLIRYRLPVDAVLLVFAAPAALAMAAYLRGAEPRRARAVAQPGYGSS